MKCNEFSLSEKKKGEESIGNKGGIVILLRK
jgi:hypothetical protein